LTTTVEVSDDNCGFKTLITAPGRFREAQGLVPQSIIGVDSDPWGHVRFFLFPLVENLAPFPVPFAAGGFIYITGSDHMTMPPTTLYG
jgi:hypothetical protein